MNDALLTRIAQALERLAPPPAPSADLAAAPAYIWNGRAIQAVGAFAPVDYDLLSGIDAQKGALLDNSRRHAAGHGAHDVLLWGARGTGKSATVDKSKPLCFERDSRDTVERTNVWLTFI